MSTSNSYQGLRIPSFLGLGTQRAATTWVHNCLKEHPQVFMPDIKELAFFDLNYDKGQAYYESFFKGATGNEVIGEITPDYIFCEACPERISRHLPNVKVFVILRNPIDRAFSAYKFFGHKHPGLSFEQAIENEPSILAKGLYYEQLQRYFLYFDQKSFLVLFYEDLMENNLRVIQEIYRVIGVDSSFLPSWIGKVSNTKIFPGISSKLEAMHLSWLLKKTKQSFIWGSFSANHPEKKEETQGYPQPKDTRPTSRLLQGAKPSPG